MILPRAALTAVPGKPVEQAVPASGYRPEIDGLRAIAVGIVILYHADFTVNGQNIFPGGFVGVDIFFVISGYLIGSLLMRQLAAGSFSFADFYERRARRILPALFVVLAAGLPFAWVWLLPNAFVELGDSIVAAVLSVSNIFFWLGDSYDAEASLFKPNIHTWSLGIEEQFYLFFPFLLLCAWKLAPRHLGRVIAGLALASLAFAEWQTARSPDASFYLLPARIWELALGVLLARLEIEHGRVSTPILTQIMPLLGLAMILGVVPFMQNHVHHPGLATLVPALGTALVIWFAGQRDPGTRLLRLRPLVGIGLISYSLYLWHQPVFAFARIRMGDEPTPADKLGWIALSFGLAVLSYRLIETPMRDRRRTSAKFVVRSSVAGAALLIAVGGLSHLTGGFPGRLPPALAPVAAAEVIPDADISQNGRSCLNYDPASGPCRFAGPDPSGYSLLTVGDSHARTITRPILDHLASTPGIATFTPLNMGRCPFVFGIERVDTNIRACPSSFNEQRLAYILRQPRPLVISAARLPFVIEGERFDNREGGVEPGDGEPRFVRPGDPWSRPADFATVRRAFATTIGTMLDRGVKVVLVYPIPAIGWNVPRKLMSVARNQSGADVLAPRQASISRALFQQRSRRSYAIYDSIPDHPNLVRIYPEALFCSGDRCMSHDNRAVFYRDDNHLSDAGGERLRAAIMRAVVARWGATGK